jgi:colicin import membrane protein
MAIRIPSIDWTQPGMVVSGVAHVALLAATLIAFADARPLEDATESIPVEVITDSQFSQMTRGETTAREVKPNPLPRAEKQADIQETKPEAVELKRDVPVPPVRPPDPPAEQKIAALPLPPERPKEDEAKAEAEKARAEADAKARADAAAKAEAQAKAEARAKADADAKAKAEAKAEAEALEKARAEQAKAKAEADAKAKAEAEAKARVEAEAKARAEARAKAEAEAEAKRRETEARIRAAEQQRLAALAAVQAKPEPPKPPAPRAEPKPEAKFDPSAIEKLLTSKEKAQQAPSTAREINRTASLGTAAGGASRLSQSELDMIKGAIIDQINAKWIVPPGADTKSARAPQIRFSLNPDGSLQGEPQLISEPTDAISRALAESAIRAIKRAAPYRIQAQFASKYQDWRDWNSKFTPPEF